MRGAINVGFLTFDALLIAVDGFVEGLGQLVAVGRLEIELFGFVVAVLFTAHKIAKKGASLNFFCFLLKLNSFGRKS